MLSFPQDLSQIHNSIILKMHINIPPWLKTAEFCPAALWIGALTLWGVYKVNFNIFPLPFQAHFQRGRERLLLQESVKFNYWVGFGANSNNHSQCILIIQTNVASKKKRQLSAMHVFIDCWCTSFQQATLSCVEFGWNLLTSLWFKTLKIWNQQSI